MQVTENSNSSFWYVYWPVPRQMAYDFTLIRQSSPEDPHPVVNTKIGGVDAYATNDLVIPHPTRKGLWKMHGRRDDQIVLSNGEKVISPCLYRQALLTLCGFADEPPTSRCVIPAFPAS